MKCGCGGRIVLAADGELVCERCGLVHGYSQGPQPAAPAPRQRVGGDALRLLGLIESRYPVPRRRVLEAYLRARGRRGDSLSLLAAVAYAELARNAGVSLKSFSASLRALGYKIRPSSIARHFRRLRELGLKDESLEAFVPPALRADVLRLASSDAAKRFSLGRSRASVAKALAALVLLERGYTLRQAARILGASYSTLRANVRELRRLFSESQR